MKNNAFIILISIFQACSHPVSYDETIYTKMITLVDEYNIELPASDSIVVYYFDGDCSFCINKFSQLVEKHDEKLLAIARTADKDVFNYKMREIKSDFESQTIVVENDKFDEILILNNIYLVDKKNEQINPIE